jgi:hypothetical protein
MSATFTISTYRTANESGYRAAILGLAVAYTTASGTRIEGTLTEHPTSRGGLMFAVTTPAGKWAAVHAGESLEVLAA